VTLVMGVGSSILRGIDVYFFREVVLISVFFDNEP